MSKNTISDKQWRNLKDRAIRANPERAKLTSKEGVEAAKKGAQQYRNRHNN